MIRWRVGEVKMRTALRSSSREPAPITTFSGRTLSLRATALRRSEVEGRLFVG